MRAGTQHLRRMGVLALACLFPQALGQDLDAPFEAGTHREAAISQLDLVVDHDGQRSYSLHDKDAFSLSLHIHSAHLPPGCHLDISDGEGGQSERFSEQADDLWGREVFGSTAKIVLQCPSKATHDSAEFLIDEYVGFYRRRQVESLCGQDDRRSAKCYQGQAEYTTARAVARVRIGGGGLCTGWLVKSVTKNMLITNNHCISDPQVAKKSLFEFDYENPSCSSTANPPNVRTFRGKRLVATDVRFDFALIELEGTPGEEFGELTLATRAPRVSERIYIPQHPGGRPKELGVKDTKATGGNCRVKTLSSATDRLRYSCDTEGGSSGSPVLSGDGNQVIGLHKEGGGCNFGNGGIQIALFRDMITPFLNSPSGPCSKGTYNDNGICRQCPTLWNCKRNACVGPGKANQRCDLCKPNFNVEFNKFGGHWCKRECPSGTYYRKNKCPQCPAIPNCESVTCTSEAKKAGTCLKCKPKWKVSPNGRWCQWSG